MKISENASSDFINEINNCDTDALQSFLERQTEPVFEAQMLRVIYGDDALACDSLTLYRRHFILFYILYRMQDAYYAQNKYLYVHFMRTQLFDYPPNGYCRFFDETQLRFCAVQTDDMYCAAHRANREESAVEGLSVKYFYFDTDNFDRLDKQTADAFINGAWDILANHTKLSECFAVMMMPETYDLSEIKKQFRILAKKYHPDVSDDGGCKFNEINRAYTILKNVITLKK